MPSDPGNASTYPATLGDGRSASGHAVMVALGPDDVRVIERDLGETNWPYATLAAAEPITRHSQDVLLTSTAAPGLTIFVGDRQFASRVAEHAAQLRVGRERWHAARVWVGLGLALFALAGYLWWAGIGPSSTLARLMPDTVRTHLGQQVIAALSNDRPVCELPAGRAALDKLNDRLTKAAGANARFKVIAVDWNLVNAFAAPGEQIVLTRGILHSAKGPDEIAGVLAHEMGHGLERHPESALIRVVGLSAAMEFVLGGNSGTLAGFGLMLAQVQYTRVAEQQADDHALAILARAGIAPRGFGEFFTRLDGRKASERASDVFDVLRTHPRSAERAKRALAQPDYPATPALDDADWQALKNICPAKTGAAPKPE